MDNKTIWIMAAVGIALLYLFLKSNGGGGTGGVVPIINTSGNATQQETASQLAADQLSTQTAEAQLALNTQAATFNTNLDEAQAELKLLYGSPTNASVPTQYQGSWGSVLQYFNSILPTQTATNAQTTLLNAQTSAQAQQLQNQTNAAKQQADNSANAQYSGVAGVFNGVSQVLKDIPIIGKLF